MAWSNSLPHCTVSPAAPRLNVAENPTCILFFLKLPQAGCVKTRLGATIGANHATQIYHHFILDLGTQLQQLPHDIMVCHTPSTAAAALRQILPARWGYQAQRGTDLGERLVHGFATAFARGYERVVAIGSDSPDLPMGILASAFQDLVHQDCVIGPAQDGGYYTLGFTRKGFCPTVLSGIPWSTELAFTTTLKQLHHQGLRVQVLPPWFDVDTWADLWSFHCRHQGDSNRSHTLTYLDHHPSILFPYQTP